MKTRDLAKEDQPREKLLEKGARALTNSELLGIIVGSGTKKVSAVTLALLVLTRYGNGLDTYAKRYVYTHVRS